MGLGLGMGLGLVLGLGLGVGSALGQGWARFYNCPNQLELKLRPNGKTR